jgi:hypothetical protein
MIGFIKYKLLKWLLKDICNNGDCLKCNLSCGNDFAYCHQCDTLIADCHDVHRELLAEARKVWNVE